MSHHKVFTPLLVLVSAVIFLDTTFYSVLTPLLPHYLNRGGFSSNTIGLLVGAYAVGTIVGIAPSSMFSTWIGPKATVIAGLILMSISTFAFARLTSPDLLVACRLVQGLAGAAAWSGGLAWVASNTPASQIGQSIGVVFAASGTGSMLGPVIGAIAIHHGIALTFSMSAWLIVAITLATPFIRPTHLAVVERSNPAVSFWKRKRSRGFRQALAFTALSGAGFGTYQVLGPIKMTHLGASPDTIAATFLMASAIQIVMGPLSGRITDRGGGTVVVVAALGCGVIGCLLAAFLNSLIATSITIDFSIMSYSVMIVAATAIISDATANGSMSIVVAMSLSDLAWASGVFVASTGGAVVAASTSDALPFVFLALLGVTAIIGLLRARGEVTRHHSA